LDGPSRTCVSEEYGKKENTNVYALCVLSGSGHKNGNVQIPCLYVQGLVAEREKVIVQGITIKYQFV
jgi:hypothetical protein